MRGRVRCGAVVLFLQARQRGPSRRSLSGLRAQSKRRGTPALCCAMARGLARWKCRDGRRTAAHRLPSAAGRRLRDTHAAHHHYAQRAWQGPGRQRGAAGTVGNRRRAARGCLSLGAAHVLAPRLAMQGKVQRLGVLLVTARASRLDRCRMVSLSVFAAQYEHIREKGANRRGRRWSAQRGHLKQAVERAPL